MKIPATILLITFHFLALGQTGRFMRVDFTMLNHLNTQTSIPDYKYSAVPAMDIQYGFGVDSTTRIKFGGFYGRPFTNKVPEQGVEPRMAFVATQFIQTQDLWIDHTLGIYIMIEPTLFHKGKYSVSAEIGLLAWSESWVQTFGFGDIMPLFEKQSMVGNLSTTNSIGAVVGLQGRYSMTRRLALMAGINATPVSYSVGEFGFAPVGQMSYNPLRLSSIRLGIEFSPFNI